MISKEIIVSKENEKRPEILRIGVDLDDTIFDIDVTSLEYLNKKFGTKFSKSDIKEFRYVQALLRELGLTEEKIDSYLDEVYRLPDQHRVYRDSPPIAGAIEVLNKLHDSGYRVYILTARPPGLEVITEEQLRDAGVDWISGDWVKGGNILIRDRCYWKSMTSEEFKLRAITGSFEDGKYVNFPGLDLHLDDMGELIHHPLAADIQDRIFIMARNYNIDIIPENNLVNNWWVFYEKVCSRALEELK